MEMEIDALPRFEERVLEAVKNCQNRKEPPLIWATEMAKCVGSVGFELPSPELGHVLVNFLCFSNNNPSLWKFLEHALSCYLLSPLQILALLTSRVLPHRQTQPEAYRLYLELLRRYALAIDLVRADTCRGKILNSVNETLQLSQSYKVRIVDLGHAFVLFFFSIVTGLIDSILDDRGLQMTSVDRSSAAFGGLDHMDMDNHLKVNQHFKRTEYREEIRKANSFLAMEVLTELTESRKATILLRLVHLNMPEHFNGLLQRIQFLEANTLVCSNLRSANQLLSRLSANTKRVLNFEYKFSKRQLNGMLISTGSYKAGSYSNYEAGNSACWVPFDIYMENALDGKQLPVTSAIYILAETINTLKVFNRASWQETFIALWLSAVRLVQRERDPLEGPIPHLEARLCLLLSIVPLAIARVLDDTLELCSSSHQYGMTSGANGKDNASIKHGLLSSLQVLGHFSGLLSPPASVVNAANSAAAKAASFVSNSKNSKSGIIRGSCIDSNLQIGGGNMRHLIVEACIARKLIDSSVYFWPGYVPASVMSLLDTLPVQKSPWSTFMEGGPLNDSLVNSLIATPASSLVEVEKLYHMALNGSEEESSAAAKILCGACLSRGWNIQEHVVHYVLKLLSPPIPLNFTEPRSHLVNYMPMLSVILFGASSIDTVHILSLHGMVPEVAAALMPLCEAFGSLTPKSSKKMKTGDESSIYMVFSAAFLFLLRLWKFYRPPLERCITGRGELTLEYLLLLRNSRITSHNSFQDETNNCSNNSGSEKPVYIDSYPKLGAWYCQNKSCISSTVSGLSSSSNPVHQVANKILNMIYWRMTKNGTVLGSPPATQSSSSASSSSASATEESSERPMIPAWEVLEAMPFVLEAILTACAHGMLSSRDLTTGLRDLVDFLPASLAAIVSYFYAEVTRGIWKPVLMNGTDWPSPAAILQSVESEIKEILAVAGVSVPTPSYGSNSVMLPLPMAALVSLTITFKLDKSLQYIHAVAGPALENCASSCPWPSMPIIGSLWAQKVRRWHEFIVVSCSRSVFRQNKEAVAQLLKSCFTTFFGSSHQGSTSLLTNKKGVNALLGSVISARGTRPSIAPGFLYLRSCRTIHNVQHINDVIVGLVAESSRESGERWAFTESKRLKSSQASLALAAARAKEVATLGASLLCVAGGPKLVQLLYQETIPTWFLSTRDDKNKKVSTVSRILEGYAMAYLLTLSGSIVWGVRTKSHTREFTGRDQVLGAHLDFIAGVLDGNITLGCDPATWKAYVSCLVGLVVSFAPVWIQRVKQGTLRTLACGLRGWHECELALSLLERGGVASMGYVAELLNLIT